MTVYHKGKAGLKFDIRSYQEMVVVPMKQMSNDNQKLIWLKNKVMQHEQRSKVLEEQFGVMDYQERFFKDQMDKIPVTEEKGRIFKTSSQEELTNSKQADVSPGNIRDLNHRKVKTQSFIAGPLKNVEEFEVEREKLVQLHEENKFELKQKHLTEETELEKNFEFQVTKLMEKYSSTTFEIRAPDRRRIPVRQDTAGVIDTLNRLVDKMDRIEVYTRMRHQHIAGMHSIDHENLRNLCLGMGLPVEHFKEYPPSPFDAEGYLIEHSVEDSSKAEEDAEADNGAEEEGDVDDDEE